MGVKLPRDPINFVPVTTNDWARFGNAFNYGYTAGDRGGCVARQNYVLVYTLESGVSSTQLGGVSLCNGTTQTFPGAVTVGMSPAM